MSELDTPISRRRFLKTGCIAAAAIGVTLCGGGTLIATAKPQIDFPSTTYGDVPMNQRILVAYASKSGTTAEIAARVGERLSKRGANVDVLDVRQVKDLAVYQAVVLGSAIRMGSILPPMLTFVKNHSAELQSIPLSVFVACMTLETDTPENRETVSAYLDPLRAVAQPVNEGLFAGAVLLERLPLIERWMTKSIKSPVGDFRRWDQIDAWAEDLPIRK
jgi:menaquinone-dependent protoporphyrinogen oxidase